MVDIPRNEKVKIIRKTFKQFNKENGFYFLKPTLIMKDHYDIAYYLIIGPHLNRTVCDIVVQPLYIPAEQFILSISERLQFITTKANLKHFPWGNCNGNPQKFEDEINEIFEIFSNEGMIWFYNFSSPQEIINTSINFNEEKHKVCWNSTDRLETRAISYLYIGDIEKGIYTFKHALPPYQKIHPNTVKRYEDWIKIAQNESERLPQIFDDIILTTRKNLKLKDEKCELLNKRKLEETNKIIL